MHGQIKDQEKQIAKLSETVKALQQELILAKKAQGASGGDDDLQKQLEELRSENSGLVVWLWLTQGEIADLRDTMEGKISETTQVQNLKKMLQTKNDQVKDLKTRLSKYEKD